MQKGNLPCVSRGDPNEVTVASFEWETKTENSYSLFKQLAV